MKANGTSGLLASLEERLLRAFAHGADPKVLLQEICDASSRLLGDGLPCSFVSVPDARLLPVVADGEREPDYEQIATSLVRQYMSEILNDKRVITAKVEHDNPADGPQPPEAGSPPAACWIVSVDDGAEDVLGALAVGRPTNAEPDPTEMELLESLGHLAGLLMKRANMELELARERERLRMVLDATQTAFWEWRLDTEEHYLSRRGHLILDDPDRELVGAAFFEGIHPEDRVKLTEIVQDYVEGESEFVETELRVRTKRGRKLTMLVRCRIKARDIDGAPLSVAGTLQDITLQKEHEARRHRLERIEALAGLAGGVAHDFNNILVGIRGGIEMAGEDLDEDHPSLPDLAIAREGLLRAIELTEQLAIFARGGSPTARSVDLGKLLPGVLRFALAGSGIRPELELSQDLRPVLVDETRIREAFHQLVQNARDAMRDSGNLYVRVENVDPDEQPGSKPFVRVVVQDDGPGIPTDDLHLIFDPYFTTRETGAGLGLAMVHSVVHRAGGAVSVTSTPDEGATFELLLPAAPRPEDLPSQE